MPYTLLLVDDDKDFRAIFKYYLPEYNIIETTFGHEALDLLKKPNLIDLVILDQMLPDLRGTDLLRDIKLISPDLSIIILTGHSSKEVAIEALRGHADDYIEKPFDALHIKNIIDKVLEKKALGEGDVGNDVLGKVETAKNYLKRNSHKMVSLNEIAQYLCVSSKYLSRIFKEVTGKSFTEYRLEEKMDTAKEILETTDFNINQVANKLGYENPESFIRLFKKITGTTPTEFRKKA